MSRAASRLLTRTILIGTVNSLSAIRRRFRAERPPGRGGARSVGWGPAIPGNPGQFSRCTGPAISTQGCRLDSYTENCGGKNVGQRAERGVMQIHHTVVLVV